jgi:hypothetical protein
VPDVSGCQSGEGCQCMGLDYQDLVVSVGEFRVVWVVVGAVDWEDGRLVVSACLLWVIKAFRGGREVQLVGVMR